MTAQRPVLVPKVERARKDVTATEAGVKFRVAGAQLQIAGTVGLHPHDVLLLKTHFPTLRERLMPAEPEGDLLDQLGADVEVIRDEARPRGPGRAQIQEARI
jgi:hypothetical protein